MDQLALGNYVTVTKIFRFEMGHVLYNYDGPCRNLHGHSYKLHVSLAGNVKNDPGAPDDGMLMDFSDLKKMVQERIINRFDHALAINQRAPYAAEFDKLGFERVVQLNFQPTCENLIRHFAHLLVPALPQGVKLQRLRLFETETSYAEWYA